IEACLHAADVHHRLPVVLRRADQASRLDGPPGSLARISEPNTRARFGGRATSATRGSSAFGPKRRAAIEYRDPFADRAVSAVLLGLVQETIHDRVEIFEAGLGHRSARQSDQTHTGGDRAIESADIGQNSHCDRLPSLLGTPAPVPPA